MDVKIKCAEPGCEEPEETKVEKLTKLSCHIEGAVAVGDGTNKGGTDMLPQAILKGLEDSFEKISPTLGRSALYNKSLRIKKLPKYLITQLVRFYYRRDTQKKAKILRSVKFPMMLDMKEYCTEEYQSRIEKFREQALAKQEAEKEAKKKQKRGEAPDAGAAEGTAPAAAAPAGDDVMDVDLSGDENLWANYECTGVLTHQVGRAVSLNLLVVVMITSGIWACRMCFLAFGSGSELGFGLLFGFLFSPHTGGDAGRMQYLCAMTCGFDVSPHFCREGPQRGVITCRGSRNPTEPGTSLMTTRCPRSRRKRSRNCTEGVTGTWPTSAFMSAATRSLAATTLVTKRILSVPAPT